MALDLDGMLRRLHLPTVRRLYPELETRAETESLSHRDFLATRWAATQPVVDCEDRAICEVGTIGHAEADPRAADDPSRDEIATRVTRTAYR